MLFIDEETRKEFHEAQTLVQVVCLFLENKAYEHDIQLRVIGIAENDALVQLVSGKSELMLPICNAVNQMFKRKDEQPVCSVKDMRLRYILVHVTHPADLAHLL